MSAFYFESEWHGLKRDYQWAKGVRSSWSFKINWK